MSALRSRCRWRWPGGVLQGYRNRYSELRDAITETEPDFDEERLAEIAVVDLLTAPIGDVADRWRTD